VEDGVHRRRQPIDDFIFLNAVPGTMAHAAATRITLERTLNAAVGDAIRSLRENEVAMQKATRDARKAKKTP
jgi:ABC-type branched-subunit amino acid transport system permease subunit